MFDGGESRDSCEGSVDRDAGTAQATPLSGVVLALSLLSFGIFLASSDAVRFVLAEIARLFGKFSS
jgi:hypothetical protein